MSKHTKEPWSYGYSTTTELSNLPAGIESFVIGVNHNDSDFMECVCLVSPADDVNEKDQANAKRIVDCVNALEGLSNDALDGGWNFKDMSKHCREVEQQRDELLEALERIHLHAKGFFLLNHTGDEFNQWFEQAAKAIAKAKGEAND